MSDPGSDIVPLQPRELTPAVVVHRLLQRLRTKEPEAVRQAQLEGLERDAR